MKKQYTLSIPQPCSENWDAMTPTQQGKHCALCQTEVHDFTKMSDRELIDFLNNHQVACGRYRPDQLNHKLSIPDTNPVQKWKWLGVLGSLLLAQTSMAVPFHTTKVEKQTEQVTHINSDSWLIKGKVISSEDASAIATAHIVLEGTDRGTVTDVDGNFTLALSKADFSQEQLTLICSRIGYETQTITVTEEQSAKIQINLNTAAVELEEVTIEEDNFRVDCQTVMGGVHIHKYQKDSVLKWLWTKVKRFPRWVTTPLRSKDKKVKQVSTSHKGE